MRLEDPLNFSRPGKPWRSREEQEEAQDLLAHPEELALAEQGVRREVKPMEDHAEENGAQLLVRVERHITKYAFLPVAARLVLALWAITTHVFDIFDAFPYVGLLSPTKGSGKTRTLEILEGIVREPWRATSPSVAALFRYIHKRKPTLLWDECEGLSSAKVRHRLGADNHPKRWVPGWRIGAPRRGQRSREG